MLRIAVPDLVSNSYFPAIAAVELGFFKTAGYDASIDLLFPIPKTFEALRDGELDFVVGSAHATLLAFPEWQGAKLLAAVGQHTYWFLVIRSDLNPQRGDLPPALARDRAQRRDARRALARALAARCGASPGGFGRLRGLSRARAGLTRARRDQTRHAPGRWC